MAKILLVRGKALTSEEFAIIQAAFPGEKLDLVPTSPLDYLDHAENCRIEKPDVVVLPKDRPVPSLAMQEGFAHVVITPDGLKELLPLVPEFKPFKPKPKKKR